MKPALAIFLVVLAGCSTLASRRDDPPIFQRTTQFGLKDFEGCFAGRVSRQDVQYLPRTNGGSFSAGVTTGAARYVIWVVDIDDLGRDRRVSVYSARENGKLVIPSVEACV